MPIGILFDEISGTISGTPSSALTTTSYTITANLGNGVQKQASLTIAIEDIGFNYPEIKGIVGEEIQTAAPYWPEYGAAGETYEISPSLPNGLMLNTETGEISGTPTTHTSTTYTVTATFAGDITREANLKITIEQVSFSYSGDIVGISGEHILDAIAGWNNPPSSTTTYEVKPPLPEGIKFHSTNGQIYGTPTVAHSMEHTITATFGVERDLTASATIKIEITDPQFSYSGIVGAVTKEIPPGLPVWTVEPPAGTTYSSDSLPLGIRIDSATGEISGNSESLLSNINASITASFPRYAMRTAGVSITINKMKPATKAALAECVEAEIGRLGMNADLSTIDTSDITDMSSLFSPDVYSFTADFYGNLSSWDVSSVTNMSEMFKNAKNFNGIIGSWEVMNVTDMGEMFDGAAAFDQDIGNWDVREVIRMERMFYNAIAFNQDIGNWNVEKVTDMGEMFDGAAAFDQDIGNWDVREVIRMERMFYNAIAFNQDIGNWNVEKVTDMGGMFRGAISFNQNIGGWNVENVTDMSWMFAFSTPASRGVPFNQDIGGWNVSKVTSMWGMFAGTSDFNQDIGNWTVANVADMRLMFRGAASFDQDIGGWNVGSVTDMSEMFYNAAVFNQNLNSWNVGSVTNMSEMFVNSGMTSTPSWYTN